MRKNRGIYGFLAPSWVLITMAPRNTALYKNLNRTLIPSNLSQKRDCSFKRISIFSSSAVYKKLYRTLISSNLSQKRDCSSKRDNPF